MPQIRTHQGLTGLHRDAGGFTALIALAEGTHPAWGGESLHPPAERALVRNSMLHG